MATRLTWLEASHLEDGTRVVFVTPQDIFPICIIPEGTTATVVSNTLDDASGLLAVLPDDKAIRHDLAEWDGEIHVGYCEVDHTVDATWQNLSPLALIPVEDRTEEDNAVAFVSIDYDQDAPYQHSVKDYDPDKKYVVLEMVAYTADRKITGSLCEIDFFEDEDDWITGTFERVSDIPVECDHLRQIAKDLGLPD